MRSQQVRLAFGAVYWRVALIVAAAVEFLHWQKIGHACRHRTLAQFDYWVKSMPGKLIPALGYAALGTLALALIVRHGVGPLVARWHDPRRPPGDFGGSHHFHLGAGERGLASARARRRVEKGWMTGTLVRTDRRVWFFPDAWEAAPWSIALGEINDLGTRPAPRAGLGFIEGMPDRFRIGGAAGVREVFAVPDPDLLLTWAEPPAVPRG